MTLRDTAGPEGAPSWGDQMVADPKRATEFYGALFGWDFQDHGVEYGHHAIATLEGRAVAAIGPHPSAVEDRARRGRRTWRSPTSTRRSRRSAMPRAGVPPTR